MLLLMTVIFYGCLVSGRAPNSHVSLSPPPPLSLSFSLTHTPITTAMK